MREQAASELVQRVERGRADVALHKAAIRRHRERLGRAKSQLLELEAQCRRLGIALTVVDSDRGPSSQA